MIFREFKSKKLFQRDFLNVWIPREWVWNHKEEWRWFLGSLFCSFFSFETLAPLVALFSRDHFLFLPQSQTRAKHDISEPKEREKNVTWPKGKRPHVAYRSKKKTEISNRLDVAPETDICSCPIRCPLYGADCQSWSTRRFSREYKLI